MKKAAVPSILVVVVLIAVAVIAEAQETKKVPRIGIVRGDPNAPAPSIKVFRQALQDLGYVEGKNILFEYRYTEGNRDRAKAIVAELVALKVDILFSTQAGADFHLRFDKSTAQAQEMKEGALRVFVKSQSSLPLRSHYTATV
jgi:ABC-type uncharacterized transport system substrate-binding protein